MADSHSPQAIWGRELRHYRQAAGLTQEELAAEIHFSTPLISGVETGRLPATPEFAEACDQALKTGGALVRLLDWRKEERFPSWFRAWVPEEERATLLRTFQLSVVYGLLQTDDYARALLDDDESAVAARLERQRILTRTDPPPPTLHCVLDESVLYRDIGGPKVMRDQLMHMVEIVVADQVTVQIVRARKHKGISGSFVLATLNDKTEVAYVETITGGQVMGGADDLATVTLAWESIRSRALPDDMSIELIKRTVEERWT
jgi:transcriptional regulator with XRE-family HTH domain